MHPNLIHVFPWEISSTSLTTHMPAAVSCTLLGPLLNPRYMHNDFHTSPSGRHPVIRGGSPQLPQVCYFDTEVIYLLNLLHPTARVPFRSPSSDSFSHPSSMHSWRTLTPSSSNALSCRTHLLNISCISPILSIFEYGLSSLSHTA